MVGAIPLIVHSPRWLLKHWATHHIVPPPLFAGIKNNTHAMVGVTPYGVRSPRSASQHVAGIKNNTRAVTDISGIWQRRACKCRIIFVTCQSKLMLRTAKR